MEALVKKLFAEIGVSCIIEGELTMVKGSDPEVIVFVNFDEEKNIWNYGVSNRGIERIKVSFQEKDEALLYSIYDNYTLYKRLQIRSSFDDQFDEINIDNTKEQMEFIEKNIDPLYLSKLKIKDNNNLIYLDKFTIPKEGLWDVHNIATFYYIQLFFVISYDQTKNDLINLGVDKKQLENYFKFERLITVSRKKYM